MPVELFIALRYLKARRNGVFTMLTTIIGIGGITLGVAALIITLAVMSGFQRDIKDKILGLQPHIIVLKGYAFNDYDRVSALLKEQKNVMSTAPFVYGQVIIKSERSSTGAVLKGINWNEENKVVNLSKVMKDNIAGLNNGEIVIGNELALNSDLKAGDEVVLMSPGVSLIVPKMRKFKVAGIFHSGMYEYDSNMIFSNLKDSQDLFNMNSAVTGIGIRLDNIENAQIVKDIIKDKLSYPYQARTWQDMNKNLFSALKLEKIMMFIILGLIILVAAFNIISNLLLLTVEKAKEIGILAALGFNRFKIAKIFLYEGVLVGLSGILLGLLSGIGLSLLIKKYQFVHLPNDIYYLDKLPVRIIPADIAGVTAIALAITLIAVIYPAYQATKMDPIEVIRYG